MPQYRLILLVIASALATPGWGLDRYYYVGELEGGRPFQLDLGRTPSGTEWTGHTLLPREAGQRTPVSGPASETQQLVLEPRQPGVAAAAGAGGRIEGQLSADGRQLTGTASSAPFSLRRVARYRERTENAPQKFPAEDCPCAAAPLEMFGTAGDADAICLCEARQTLTYPVFDGATGDAVEQILGSHPTLAAGQEAVGTTDLQTVADIWYYTPHLLSLRVDRFIFYPFNADAEQRVRAINLAIPEQGPARELTLDDLIQPNDDCHARLNEAILADLRTKEAPAVVDPEFWGAEFSRLHESPVLIGPAGLTFLLEPYDVGPYATGAFYTTTPYSAIAECIPKDSPIADLLPR